MLVLKAGRQVGFGPPKELFEAVKRAHPPADPNPQPNPQPSLQPNPQPGPQPNPQPSPAATALVLAQPAAALIAA